jgi:hypothetical protein
LSDSFLRAARRVIHHWCDRNRRSQAREVSRPLPRRPPADHRSKGYQTARRRRGQPHDARRGLAPNWIPGLDSPSFRVYAITAWSEEFEQREKEGQFNCSDGYIYDIKKRHPFTSRAFHYTDAVQDLIAAWEGLRDTRVEEAWDIYSPWFTQKYHQALSYSVWSISGSSASGG